MKYDFKYAAIDIRQNAFKIKWGCEGIGFGELFFRVKEDGTTEIQTECMSDQFVHELFEYLISNAKRVD